MPPEFVVNATCQQFRKLMDGQQSDSPHEIEAGRFRSVTTLTGTLIEQSSAIFGDKPYEVDWTEGGSPDPNQPVTGNLVDVQFNVVVRVGYLRGVGRGVARSEDAYQDEKLIRRTFEELQNYDNANTGLMTVTRTTFEREVLDDEREILSIQFACLAREDQPT